jgi:hypothetical protein
LAALPAARFRLALETHPLRKHPPPGVDGVLHAASLGLRALGQSLASAQGLAPRHAIKPVDRLLSNPQLSMERLFA